MKVLKYKHNDKVLILFEKSGSSLMSKLFKTLSDWKGYEVINSSDLKHGDLTLIVRDPIDRFISSFFHTKIDKDVDYFKNQSLILDKFDKFIAHYENTLDTISDSHVYSQLWTFQQYGIDIRENHRCKIFHLEDIDKGFQHFNKMYKGTDNIHYDRDSIHFDGEEWDRMLPIFKHLGMELEIWDKFHIFTLYYYILQSLNNHHRGLAGEFRKDIKKYREDLYGRVIRLLYEENYTLGYSMML